MSAWHRSVGKDRLLRRRRVAAARRPPALPPALPLVAQLENALKRGRTRSRDRAGRRPAPLHSEQVGNDGADLRMTAAMLDALPDPVSRYRTADHVITYCNQAWATQYRTSRADAVGRPLEEFLSDDEVAGLLTQLSTLGPECPILEDVAAREVANNPGRWLHWIDRYLELDTGAEILSIGRDVTDRRNAEARLAASEASYRDLADRSADIVWRVQIEPSLHFDYISPSVEHILGFPPGHFLDDFSQMLELLDESGIHAIRRALNGERVLDHFDFQIRRADGTTIIGETRTADFPGGLQGVTRDVTDIRRLQATVADLALRDPLTGLANRRLLEELLDAELTRAEQSARPIAVAFLDLDNFKHVNDQHGHHAGDAVLTETARRLQDTMGSSSTVARVGGDEFVIVYDPTLNTATALIARLDHILSQPISLPTGTLVVCRASIGIAETSAIGRSRDALLAAADQAMYEQKRRRCDQRRGTPTVSS